MKHSSCIDGPAEHDGLVQVISTDGRSALSLTVLPWATTSRSTHSGCAHEPATMRSMRSAATVSAVVALTAEESRAPCLPIPKEGPGSPLVVWRESRSHTEVRLALFDEARTLLEEFLSTQPKGSNFTAMDTDALS